MDATLGIAICMMAMTVTIPRVSAERVRSIMRINGVTLLEPQGFSRCALRDGRFELGNGWCEWRDERCALRLVDGRSSDVAL